MKQAWEGYTSISDSNAGSVRLIPPPWQAQGAYTVYGKPYWLLKELTRNNRIRSPKENSQTSQGDIFQLHPPRFCS